MFRGAVMHHGLILRGCLFIALCSGLAGVPICEPTATAAESVSERIDAIIETAAGGPVADIADDWEFCRRLHLDLVGRIPTVTELEAFVADTSPEKRRSLIDRLIESDEFPKRMRSAWHIHLMERLGDHEEWTAFLEASFAQNRPWDQFVRAILLPDATQETARGAAYFFTRRLENYGQNPVDLPGLTRDVGRLFLGVDLQCAQCHDHLFIDDYKQVDFQGLHTFVSHTTIRQDVKFPAIAEKLVDKKTDFMSVFIKEPHQTGPRLPFGAEFEIAVFEKGAEFSVPPDRQTRFPGQPKFSPLSILAESLPRWENRLFVQNAVNRWWWQFMGRGLIHPLDLTHAGNPASHPEVLELLCTEFAAQQGDVRWLIRTITNTRAYQRSSRWTAADQPLPAPDRFALAIEKSLSAEQLAASMWAATGHAEPLPSDALSRFQAAFANPPREPEGDFAPSVKAALYLSHSALLQKWVDQSSAAILAAVPADDFEQRAGYAWKLVLSRQATPDEQQLASALRTRTDDDATALRQLVWALLNTTEFCLNH